MVDIMGRSTVHYTDNETNNILKRLHNKLRPAGTPVQRVEYIIELLLLRIFEIKLRQDENFRPLREIFSADNDKYLFSYLQRLTGEQIKSHLNKEIFPFYAQILSRARVGVDDFLQLQTLLPPLEIQQKIVEELDREMESLEKVKLLKEKAEKRIEEILNEVWGDEKN